MLIGTGSRVASARTTGSTRAISTSAETVSLRRWPRALAADVDDVRTVHGEQLRARHGRLDIIAGAVAGERVRCDIEDPHHEGAPAELKTMPRDLDRWGRTATRHEHRADRSADLARVVAPRGELRRQRARGHQWHEQHGAVAVGVAEHLTAAIRDQALDDSNLVRAQAAKRERLDGAALREHGEPLRGKAEAQHRIA